MKILKRTILFLFLNFTALGIGGLFTGSGVASMWYQNINKAPWTPPGWVFGVAWTSIMICFAIYMAYLLNNKAERKKITVLFSLQWILNIAWNPLFFYMQEVLLGMMNITLLTVLVTYLFFNNRRFLKVKSIFIMPYMIWLFIATSLNLYILIYN